MRSFKREDFTEDTNEKELLHLYDLMDKDKKEYNNKELGLEYEILEKDANDLLEKVGIDYSIDFSSIDKSKLDRICDTYFNDEFHYDSNKEYNETNPFLLKFSKGRFDAKDQIYILGYMLGTGGSLGKYFKLLVNDNFASGYIAGRIKQIEYNYDPKIEEDIMKYNECMHPSSFEHEMYIKSDNKKLIKNLVKDANY